MSEDLRSYFVDAPHPEVASSDAHFAFEEKAREMGLDPNNSWIGGYVAYEWTHLRPILESYGLGMSGKRVLEFGTNVGASAIVMAKLGAVVTAIDIDPSMVQLARLNAGRFGCDSVHFFCVPDTTVLPFSSESFDLVVCNSVLEYVHPDVLAAVQREIDRVVAPGGRILVTGTSSRLSPRETHTGRWFINYVPEAFDSLLAPALGDLRRGVSPWKIRHGFGPHYRNLDARDEGQAFLESRRRMSPSHVGPGVRFVAWLGATLGVGPGLLMTNLSCVLEKTVTAR